ncbi:hypothetical protein CXQ85_005412 [Candidozyma haemuli]|uniref:Folylpolyglutamate synthase n=1 Tax=Candidozyma haemuli TaxID=45357 RepID=A0A2V1AXA7_9ASCO|nr:hypothetical protein CXQ85_005412 [[Candida] haemuloni]PVH22730.1 hypothetical protein CXQ85_005412 [[Candida] haemuloni]
MSNLNRSYKDAIAALNSLQSNFASIEALKSQKDFSPKQRSELSIAEVYEYIRRLGYKPVEFDRLNVVHVTGTKGKGSTCAFTDSVLRQYKGGVVGKVGLFTSPHLKSVRERIRIDGQPITEQKFTKYFYEVWDKLSATSSSPSEFPSLQPCESVKPMYFKYLTILSFHVFMAEGVNTAIYEVGVGGRYDSTNIIQNPTVAGVTSLGIDHTFMLGNTIDSIAWNKAGIFKKNCPAIVSEQSEFPESIDIVKKAADEIGVSSFEVVDGSIIPTDIKLGLAGDFQRQNAAVAVKLADIHLRKLGVPDAELPTWNGSPTLPDKFVAGLENTRWDGRCQKLTNQEGFENITWYIDGAHTLESIHVASKWFTSSVTKQKPRPGAPKILLFNQQSRENVSELLEKLHGTLSDANVKFDHVIFTTNITWSDGSYNSDLVSLNNSKEQVDKLVIQKELAEKWNALDQAKGQTSRKHIFPNIETSLNFIKSLTNDDHHVDAFVCGSLHLVEDSSLYKYRRKNISTHP